MGVEFNDDGLDDFKDSLDELEGENEVPVTDLFPPSFMRQHSDASSFEEFVEESPFDQDFEEIPDDPWDEYVSENTSFDGWLEMQKVAGREWVKSQF